MHQLSFGDVTQTDRSDGGLLTHQIGDFATNEVLTDNVQRLGPANLVSSPPSAASKGAPQALLISYGEEEYLLGVRDVRTAALAGKIGPGETCLLGPGPNATGQAGLFLKDDGSKSHVTIKTTKDNSSSGVMIAIQIDSDGNVSIQNGKQVFQMLGTGDTIISNKDGSASVGIGDDGTLNLIGSTIYLQGTVSAGGSEKLPLDASLQIELTKIAASFAALISAAPGAPVTGATYLAPSSTAASKTFGA